MTYTADITIPAGRLVCWECHGTGRTANPYAHECTGPLCEGEPPVIECASCDGQGHTDADGIA
ncbi:hypothetical protein SEA_CUMBERBATCH_23 [Streptomyces phage Cumberbatch]|uniref:Uncharacterized protein n=4 Tax=Ignaciovirus TaxID=3152509 RepID=A0A7D5FM34_9CAUD|nr:hypothetical protein QEN61_gp23 [Streptomyces phage Eklok]YP_010756259.1 hypothetical protein QEN62_gp23 [Streptomyces phage AxeJC]YP_010756433.1 hypothetical protein QEN65_gp23 [Streptomyces phage Cumberbatch]YP_010756492.1 hypothetical protein QEN66_gp23 [Streptomyces phage Piccadilly]YP_010756550.1 hypothetical protein QEN67_gp23 [Streptomyces phage Eastland]QKN87665.1 hypothetical protein SEA_CUMBERBATCH_23 [Streptomyces phage Cumberbatch]QLF83209.1 hypothetical protein SEA_EKLOK_23 [S